MSLFLHSKTSKNGLSSHYQRAFKKATELYIVSAYLTEWDGALMLNPKCEKFRIIVGKDFGITRKAACEAVMRWLPKKRLGSFLVADGISGFHPKAVFWKETTGKCFSIVGSSNLTRAAFESNYEANLFSNISEEEFSLARQWIGEIEENSIIVSDGWLNRYVEARYQGAAGAKRGKAKTPSTPSLVNYKLTAPKDAKRFISERRQALAAYKNYRRGLIKLFRRCASREISSKQFYEDLKRYWSSECGDRIQGPGFAILGKASNFTELSKSYLRILDAKDDRDTVVASEIDRLAALKIPTRKSFLSEMLCLEFPDRYPLLNRPVQIYISRHKMQAPAGVSEGERYIDLAKQLREAIRQNPGQPAKNLAELDAIMWYVVKHN